MEVIAANLDRGASKLTALDRDGHFPELVDQSTAVIRLIIGEDENVGPRRERRQRIAGDIDVDIPVGRGSVIVGSPHLGPVGVTACPRFEPARRLISATGKGAREGEG